MVVVCMGFEQQSNIVICFQIYFYICLSTLHTYTQDKKFYLKTEIMKQEFINLDHQHLHDPVTNVIQISQQA